MSSDTGLEIQKITSTLQFNRTISCKSKAGQREKRGSLVGLTTDEVRGWPRAIEGSNKRPKTHPQNTTQQGKNLDEPKIKAHNTTQPGCSGIKKDEPKVHPPNNFNRAGRNSQN